MTREEAIKELKELEYYNRPFDNSAESAEVATKKAQAVDMAIKALEQTELNSSYNSINSIKTELNDDAISRQALKDLGAECIAKRDENGNLIPLGSIDSLPSVSTEKTETVTEFADRCRECGERYSKLLKEKTGRWEWVQYDYNPKIGNWHCSECRSVVIECVDKNEKSGIPLYKYCPQCGAKMEVEE